VCFLFFHPSYCSELARLKAQKLAYVYYEEEQGRQSAAKRSGCARLCSKLYSAATINGFFPLAVRAVGISTTRVSKSSFGVLIIG
jgi:hypothetical protein